MDQLRISLRNEIPNLEQRAEDLKATLNDFFRIISITMEKNSTSVVLTVTALPIIIERIKSLIDTCALATFDESILAKLQLFEKMQSKQTC